MWIRNLRQCSKRVQRPAVFLFAKLLHLNCTIGMALFQFFSLELLYLLFGIKFHELALPDGHLKMNLLLIFILQGVEDINILSPMKVFLKRNSPFLHLHASCSHPRNVPSLHS